MRGNPNAVIWPYLKRLWEIEYLDKKELIRWLAKRYNDTGFVTISYKRGSHFKAKFDMRLYSKSEGDLLVYLVGMGSIYLRKHHNFRTYHWRVCGSEDVFTLCRRLRIYVNNERKQARLDIVADVLNRTVLNPPVNLSREEKHRIRSEAMEKLKSLRDTEWRRKRLENEDVE